MPCEDPNPARPACAARQHTPATPQTSESPGPSCSDAALNILLAYSFPGNVRQLEHIVQRAIATARGPELLPDDLPEELLAEPGLPGTEGTVAAARDKAEREMIVVAVSIGNQCQYCVVAHGAILRVRAKDPAISELVAANWRKAPLSARQRAILAYATKVAQTSHLVTEEDRAALIAAGLTQDELWDVGAIAAFFSMSNRLANSIELKPNPEFQGVGR